MTLFAETSEAETYLPTAAAALAFFLLAATLVARVSGVSFAKAFVKFSSFAVAAEWLAIGGVLLARGLPGRTALLHVAAAICHVAAGAGHAAAHALTLTGAALHAMVVLKSLVWHFLPAAPPAPRPPGATPPV